MRGNSRSISFAYQIFGFLFIFLSRLIIYIWNCQNYFYLRYVTTSALKHFLLMTYLFSMIGHDICPYWMYLKEILPVKVVWCTFSNDNMTLKGISFGFVAYQTIVTHAKSGYLHLYKWVSPIFIQNLAIE